MRRKKLERLRPAETVELSSNPLYLTVQWQMPHFVPNPRHFRAHQKNGLDRILWGLAQTGPVQNGLSPIINCNFRHFRGVRLASEFQCRPSPGSCQGIGEGHVGSTRRTVPCWLLLGVTLSSRHLFAQSLDDDSKQHGYGSNV